MTIERFDFLPDGLNLSNGYERMFGRRCCCSYRDFAGFERPGEVDDDASWAAGRREVLARHGKGSRPAKTIFNEFGHEA